MRSKPDDESKAIKQLMELEQLISQQKVDNLAATKSGGTVHVLSAKSKVWLIAASDLLSNYPQIVNSINDYKVFEEIAQAQLEILSESQIVSGFAPIITALGGATPAADASFAELLCEMYTLLGGTDPCKATAKEVLNQISGVI